nr:PHP domain-containing protein [Bacteroidales bacterium]
MTLPKANYHTHSLYCDGKEPLAAYVAAAEERQFVQLGFSSHAPVPFENDFGITLDQIPTYCAEIDRLQQSTNVHLLKSLECDFIPGMSTPFRQFKEQYQLDYIIGGVHLVRPPHRDGLWFIDGSKREIYDDGLHNLFDGNVQRAVTTFWEQTFEMLETEQLDVIAHFDKIKMHN